MKKETIIIYADVLERGHFFARFHKPLQTLGYDVIFITARLSIEKYLKGIGATVSVLKKGASTKKELPLSVDYTLSLSVLNHYHTLQQAQSISISVLNTLNTLVETRSIKMFWIWNGTTTIARTINTFAKEKQIQTRFFEISNLPQQIFVDIEGTSGASYLSQHPNILDEHTPDDTAYRQWLRQYHNQDLQPKQAANRSKIPWSAFIDIFGYAKGYIREDKRSVFKLLFNRLSNRYINPTYTHASLDEPYIFLPLQVSDDSQLKLFSSYCNIDLIHEAHKIAEQKGLHLIVKIHPAESDRSEIQKIQKLSQSADFTIANNPTMSLIKNADLIIVNNSTVGLQALIEEKEVMVFGKALYKEFDQRRLKVYILQYLLSADYFGDAPVPITTVKAVLQHDRWKIPDTKEVTDA